MIPIPRYLLLLSTQLNILSLASWVDPDTPDNHHTTLPLSLGDDKIYNLVFSDEFEVEGRRFDDGTDPRWTALHKNDYTNNPLHYYSNDAVRSRNGSMSISISIDPRDDLASLTEAGTEYKEFKTGMVQSWNKFCFTGGIIEFSAKMPGTAKTAGLWPAIWMMGNLGRATYIDSTENMWPFSTNVCDERTRNSQLINSCWGAERFPGMPAGRGRGAPEIDLFEVMMMDQYFTNPILSTSLQVAPGVPDSMRPQLGQPPNVSNAWYSPEYGQNASRNTWFYGTVSYPEDVTKIPYRTDSLSANVPLNDDFYENYHKFRIEWEPPEETGKFGYIKWFIDDSLITAVDGHDLQATSQTEIPSEPMYIVMNLAVSKDWGFPDAWFKGCPKKCWSCLDPDCTCALPKTYCSSIPTSLEIDYVRLYQPANQEKYSIGCSPPNRPTKEYIDANKDKYKLPGETEPLQEVTIGGGDCVTSDDCGTIQRGLCSQNRTCSCASNWTGPNCLAYGQIATNHAEIAVTRESGGLEWLILVLFLVLAAIIAQGRSFVWDKSEKRMFQVLASISPDDLEMSDESHVPLASYQKGYVGPLTNTKHP